MHNIAKAYVRIAIFDADGVVTSPKRFADDLARDFGTKPEDLTPFFQGPFQDALIGKADLKMIIQPYLKDWNWAGTVDEFLAYWFKAEDEINEQVLSIVTDLRERGIKCYLATNQEKYRLEYMRKKMGFERIFNGVFSSSDLGCKKPDKQFFERLLKRLDPRRKVPTKEILFWDDTEANIDAAKKFGIQAYLFTDNESFVKTMLDVPITSPRFLRPRKK